MLESLQKKWSFLLKFSLVTPKLCSHLLKKSSMENFSFSCSDYCMIIFIFRPSGKFNGQIRSSFIAFDSLHSGLSILLILYIHFLLTRSKVGERLLHFFLKRSRKEHQSNFPCTKCMFLQLGERGTWML